MTKAFLKMYLQLNIEIDLFNYRYVLLIREVKKKILLEKSVIICYNT